MVPKKEPLVPFRRRTFKRDGGWTTFILEPKGPREAGKIMRVEIDQMLNKSGNNNRF